MEDSVLRLLSLRPRSIQEVRLYLARKQVDATLIEEIIATFVQRGLLDDQEFARWLINSRAKKHGPARIRLELRRFGIAEEIYQPLLPSTEQTAEAASLLLDRQSRYHPLSDLRVKKRAYDYLIRHWFSATVARNAVDGKGSPE